MSAPLFYLFTDAACRGNNNPDIHSEAGASGVLVFNNKIRRVFGKYLYDKTNNYGELYAILHSLRQTIDLMEKLPSLTKPYQIMVVTDSKLAFDGLTMWHKGWRKSLDKDGKTWLNSSGTPVINQELYMEILKIIENRDYQILFRHTRGHMNLNDPKDIKKFKENYVKKNKYIPSDDEMYFIVEMNNMADLVANRVVDGKQDYDLVLETQNATLIEEERTRYAKTISFNSRFTV